MKPGAPALPSTRLLDQLRERIRCLHYIFTEKAYMPWSRYAIEFKSLYRLSGRFWSNNSMPLHGRLQPLS